MNMYTTNNFHQCKEYLYFKKDKKVFKRLGKNLTHLKNYLLHSLSSSLICKSISYKALKTAEPKTVTSTKLFR